MSFVDLEKALGSPGDIMGGAAGVKGEGVPTQSHPISLHPKRELCLGSQQ